MDDTAFRQRATGTIATLKETVKDAEELTFLDDPEWLDANFQKPFFDSRREFQTREVCKECHKQGGAFWKTDKCPMLTPVLNVTGSLSSRTIMWSRVYCKYRQEEERNSYKDRLTSESRIAPQFLEEYRFSTFDVGRHPVLPDIVNTCKRYVNKFEELRKQGVGLYIVSPNHRVGKSHLAIATLLEVLDTTETPILYYHAVTFLRDYLSGLKGWEDGGISGGMQWLDDVITFDGLLLLDDFGKEKVTESSLQTIYSLVSYRAENQLPTLYTSNYTLFPDGHYDSTRFSADGTAFRLSGKYRGVVGEDIISKIGNTVKILDMSQVPEQRVEVDF